MSTEEAKRLIDALLDGDLTEAEFLQLEAELTVSDSLRKAYLERVTLDMLLRTEAANPGEVASTEASLPMNAAGTTNPGGGQPWFQTLAAVALAVAATVMIMLSVPDESQKPSTDVAKANAAEPAVEEQATGYGVIRGQDGVHWQDGLPRATGSLLPTGDLRLASGVLQLELFSGVAVVVEGPAEFTVTSPMNMTVAHGKVRANVPEPAHGFRLSTRDGDVVDLGTDFAVDVSDGGSELHVLDGEVELQSAGVATRRLETGQAVSMSAGNVANLEVDRSRFVGQNEITNRLELAMKSRREQWAKWHALFRNDPRIVALYQVSLDGNASRYLENRVPRDEGASAGAVVAATRTTDRWQQRDGAFDFSPTGSRVRLTVPGEYQSLTLMCWVKINSLDRWYNSLFLTDGHDQHEPHWQIMDDGRLFFSVKKRDQWDASKGEKDKHIYYSPSFWDSSLSGQWIMIATVYDVDRRMVTHFVNGEPISEESIPEEYLVEQVRIGNASLCNWSSPERDEPRFAVRNLNGSLDEFVMFRVALSAGEIQEIYTQGNP